MAVVDDSSSDGSLAETPPTAHIPFADAFGAAKHLKGVTGQRKKLNISSCVLPGNTWDLNEEDIWFHRPLFFKGTITQTIHAIN